MASGRVTPSAPRTTSRAAAPRTLWPVGTGWRAAGQDLRCEQVGRDRARGNLVPEVFLDVRQRYGVLLAREADGIALGAGTGGAPDAVDVVGRILRQIEIEYVAHVRDVQP